MIEYCAEHGFPYWAAGALWVRGESLLDLGRMDEALVVLLDALIKFQATGAVTVVPSFRTAVARALGGSGQPEDGLKQLVEAERQIEETQERWYEAEMHRVFGEVLIAADDPASAEEWEVRAATSLARLWQDQGKRVAARDLLAPVYGSFTEGFDTPVLSEAKSLLEQLQA